MKHATHPLVLTFDFREGEEIPWRVEDNLSALRNECAAESLTDLLAIVANKLTSFYGDRLKLLTNRNGPPTSI